MEKITQIEKIRHSLSHVMAQAVLEFYPKTKLGVGPAIENGFYYDFLLPKSLEPSELTKIETRVRELLLENQKFSKKNITKLAAKKLFKDQPFKLELIKDLPGKTVSAYTNTTFTDLCKGPHVKNTSEINPNAFKLTKVAGAYWKGNEKNKMLTRIYGVAFETEKELMDYLKMQEEAEKRDHRILGEKLELFSFSENIGPGLVLWLPKGNIIKEELENWAKETEEKLGYLRVTTPIITKEKLFYISEHLPHYKESMYSPMDIEGENYYIKPMNCPFHHTIFSNRKRSYKELPMRLAEYGWCHRYEDSGSLFGLMRVRGMQMNDAHIYCTKEQAVKEFVDVIKLHQFYYDALGIKDYYMELALRSPKNKKYHGDNAMWKEAEKLMREAMEISKVPYIVQNDGAAFYGPKIDFQIKSITGRIFTASTNQIDLFMPKKFDLKYIDSDGKEKYVVCIHRAPLGTHERFIGFLIEHYAGAFPVWLSPVQVALLTVSDKHLNYAKEVEKKLLDLSAQAGNKIRVELKNENETLGKKIREAEMQKIPYLLIVGDKEIEAKTVSVRERGKGDLGAMSLEKFVEKVKQEIAKKVG